MLGRARQTAAFACASDPEPMFTILFTCVLPCFTLCHQRMYVILMLGQNKPVRYLCRRGKAVHANQTKTTCLDCRLLE